MPRINKVFSLTVSVEQFLKECSDTEKEELRLLLFKDQEPKQVRSDNVTIQKVTDACLNIMDIAESQEFVEWPQTEKQNLLHTVESALNIANQIKERNG